MKHLFLLFFTILSLVGLLVFLTNDTIRSFFSKAAAVPANIKITLTEKRGPFSPLWRDFSQGGEVDKNGAMVSITRVKNALLPLQPRYIRIDHVFDFAYEYRVKEIVDLGATPIISLSYYPPGVASSDTGNVYNWNLWQQKVTALVEKVSGKDNLNIDGVYYEIWNEPDGAGFGNFKASYGKDYYTLYLKTLEAIQKAKNTNFYKIGGPSLADPRRCMRSILTICQTYWLERFMQLVDQDHVRVDFLSWHRYSRKLEDTEEDFRFLTDLENRFPSFNNKEVIITEWGSDSEKRSIHSSSYDAAHFVAALSVMSGKATIAAKFEIIDNPLDTTSGWGDFSYGGGKKPVYRATELLAKLRTTRLALSGEATFVKGFASTDDNGVTFILANYDPRGSNFERVPIEITGLPNGTYRLTKTIISDLYPFGTTSKPETILIDSETWKGEEPMEANSVVLWEMNLIP